jgi:aminoglycoside phosphotransferase (APT) family kinase protein
MQTTWQHFPVGLVEEIEAILGRPIRRVQIPETGMWKSAYILSDGQTRWVARIASHPALELLRGLKAQSLAASAGVKVPALIHAAIEESNDRPCLWTLEAFVKGQSFYPAQLDRETRLTASRDMGDQLSRLHTIEAGAFGPLDATLTGAADTQEASGWHDWLDGREECLDRVFSITSLAETGRDIVHEALGRLRDSDPGVPRLCHGDFADDNLIIAEGKLAAIIDWNNVIGCDPAFDLAYGYLWNGDEECFDTLLEAYAEHSGKEPEGLRQRVLDHRTLQAAWLIDWCTANDAPEGRTHMIDVLKKITGED